MCIRDSIDAMWIIRDYHFDTCAHVILNLPGDDLIDAIESAKILSALQVSTVKLHSLYIAKNTRLCEAYENGTITLCSKEDYITRAITFLEYLNPEIAVERLFSRIPENDAVFCNWGTSWWKLKDELLNTCLLYTSHAVGLFDVNNAETDCAYNIHKKIYPASTTKILTALVALENGNLSDTVTVADEADSGKFAADEQTCGIKAGDQLTLEDLLNGLLLYSGNDNAVAIADHIAGSTEKFAEMMNAEAKKLMATNSHFVNPSGCLLYTS